MSRICMAIIHEKVEILNNTYDLKYKEGFEISSSRKFSAVKCVPNFGKIILEFVDINSIVPTKRNYYNIEIRAHNNDFFQSWELSEDVCENKFLEVMEIAAQELTDAIRYGEHKNFREKLKLCKYDCKCHQYHSEPQKILIRKKSYCCGGCL